jgi:phosphoribosylanthranilate isomerase
LAKRWTSTRSGTDSLLDSTERPQSHKQSSYRWTICALLFVATTINYVDRQVLGILAPTLQRELHWSETDYGDIVSWFSFAYAFGFLAAGRIIDWIGARRGLAAAVVAWSVAAIGTAFARTAAGFSFARAMLGVSESAIFPGSIKTIAEWFPRAAALPFIDALQLHGDESPEFCQRLAEKGIRFAKAVPVGGQALLADVPHFFTDLMMLDTMSARGFGGTGETFPWSLGRRFVKGHPEYKVIVAGGLTPHNVADAIRTIRPFGVDVTTGVESAPRRKDLRLLYAFFASVRGSDD